MIMRVEKLEDQEAAGLRAMGFTIDAEGEAGTIEADDLTIAVMRPHKAEEFGVYIELPNGSTLVCYVSRRAIVRAADDSGDGGGIR